MPAQIRDMPTLSEFEARLWRRFLDFHITRRSGFNGPERLTFADLQSWQIMTGSRLEPWEVRAIMRLDSAFFAFVAEENARKSGG